MRRAGRMFFLDWPAAKAFKQPYHTQRVHPTEIVEGCLAFFDPTRVGVLAKNRIWPDTTMLFGQDDVALFANFLTFST